MPGKLCDGTVENPKLKESKAYCEGRKAFNDNLLLADNPHPVGTADHDAWDRGHEDADPLGDDIPASETCCAE